MRYKFSMIMKLEVHITTINLNNVIFFKKSIKRFPNYSLTFLSRPKCFQNR